MGVYILPLECSLLFKVFYVVSCDHQKLWEDTVAYKYSYGALAEDKTTSQKKESPQKHSTRADFCLSSSSLLLASVCVCEILTMDCGEKQSEDGWMDGCVKLLNSTIYCYTDDLFLDRSCVITQIMEMH